MRYVAIAAVGATFWFAVATLRLLMHPPRCSAPRVATAPVVPPRAAPAPVVRPAAPNDFCAPERLSAARRDGHLSLWDTHCGLLTAKPMIDACFPDHPGRGRRYDIRVVIDPSGRVLSAVADEAVIGAPAAACVARAMKSVRYAPSSGRTEALMPYMVQ